MSGATPKELKELVKAQRSPNIDIDDQTIAPPPSKAAAVLFFLGFFGPWFWIFGGWMPMSSSAHKDEQHEMESGPEMELELDFSGAERSWRGWKWTYHPDPWVKRNRRAAAIVIPLLVLGGVGAAVAVALIV
jgi:hypothetical protein